MVSEGLVVPADAQHVPDAQGGIPAIITEMILYSRPGVIEVLPAIPSSLRKGTVKGILSRSFARINKLSWNLDEKKVAMTIISFKKQDITLIARYGIENISAPSGIIENTGKGNADCFMHLPENTPVEIEMELGDHSPMDWISNVR